MAEQEWRREWERHVQRSVQLQGPHEPRWVVEVEWPVILRVNAALQRAERERDELRRQLAEREARSGHVEPTVEWVSREEPGEDV